MSQSELILDLRRNPILQYNFYKIPDQSASVKQSIKSISLPFLDDFSKESIYPDAGLWLDSNVFINRDYPIAPPSIGVATFDGVSKTGNPYDTTLVSTLSFPADVLTSAPINLSLLPADNVFLSFYWQAEGRGNDPEASDTLLLQFYNPTTQIWKTVWFKNGYDPAANDTSFKLVHLPIVDTAWLKNDFQFRFRNYATTSGNVDHWHIDYVYLDKNRTAADTVFSDVSFVYNTGSLLKNYYAMPRQQYITTEMKSALSFTIRNNDTIVKNTSLKDTIFNSTGTAECSYNAGNANFPSYFNSGYISNPLFSNPATSDAPLYSFPAILPKDSTFTLEAILSASPDKNRWNDTLRFRQVFENYFAYDDGTTEGGYGINLSGAQIAYQFKLNVTDTLFALNMVFNWMGPNVNQQPFKIRVWADNGSGSPGALIYEDTIANPNYQYVYHSGWGNLTNMYFPYILKTPQVLSGTIYVGFIQYTNPTTTLLNLGLDKNTDARNKMFYNIGSGWSLSALNIPCSWMIRPVFGSKKGLAGISSSGNAHQILVYPNPTTGVIELPTANYSSSEIFQSDGKKIHTPLLADRFIDLSEFPNGLYLLRMVLDNGQIGTARIIVQH